MPLAPQETILLFDPLLSYGNDAPFGASVPYPECPFVTSNQASVNNPSYEAVRRFLHLAGMDLEHFGTPGWNPLGELIQPGQTVLIKPNLVLHENHSGQALECVYTHASLIRAVLDYVHIALRGKGQIIVGDAPVQGCRFEELCKSSGLDKVIEFYKKTASVPVDLVDFRQERAITDSSTHIVGVEAGPGDPRGYSAVDLGHRSMLDPISARYKRFRVTNYDPDLMSRHHNLEKNEYLISGSVLTADVVISMPKMKTHRKAGITGALKNLIGINGHKDWLPHHSKGSRRMGGDEYLRPSLFKTLADFVMEKEDVTKSVLAKKVLRPIRSYLYLAGRLLSGDRYTEGGWWGNDTIWRTVLDLNRILIYADKQGILNEVPQRKLFVIVDGILAGDEEGPLAPSPKKAGVLIGGTCAAAVDAVMARVMGFDFRKIPTVREAFSITDLPLATFRPRQIEIRTNSAEFERMRLDESGFNLHFRPSNGWRSRIELKENPPVAETFESSPNVA